MRGNEHFWLGVTLSDDPAPDNLFVVASYVIDPDGKIGSTASRVVDPAVREDLAGALRAIADGSEAPTAPHGWLTLEGFADEPGSDVDLAFDTVGYGTVVNVEHADAGEDVHAAIRSACALLAIRRGALMAGEAEYRRLEERLAALDPSRVLPAAPPEGWDAPVKKLALDMARRSI